MFKHAVALLLQRLLGKFVTFDSSMLQLSLWQGDLSFQDLQLRLSYGDGAIENLSVKIPWRALWTQPVQIKAQGIRISLHQTPKQPETELEMENVATSIDSSGDDRTYLSKLVSHIIANVQIELSDVQIRYDCDPNSLAPHPGSGTVKIGHVNLINTNSEWELEFTPQSSSAVESRKLLKTEGVAAYIEYPEKLGRTGHEDEPRMLRKYLFHEWRSTVKASLYYHSVNAAFPDVELDVDIGCVPGNITDKCEICAAHNASGNERFVLQPNQPRVHFGPEHIDVLYAILIEVKAPYDEYDRLAALTQQQASRPDGFLMVLSYAKQWLLTDCLDAIVGETFTLAADDDDDDDDEFEDAITPPSLSVRAELRHGAGIFFSARENVATEEEIVKGTQWVWILGQSLGVVKQSCVEDEIQLSVQSLHMYEIAERSESYSIIDHASDMADDDSSVTPIVRISCVVPAYQSRLVGHQPALDVQMGSIMMFIKDETLVMWMTLFAPVYLWWNQWNLSHPSKLVTYDEEQIAPIAHLGIKVEKICFVFSLHEQFCFGVELKDMVVETSEPDRELVRSDFRTGVRVFSVDESLALLQADMTSDVKGLHEIVAINNFSLTKTSHSKTHWSMSYYSCKHCTLEGHETTSHDIDTETETAMYNYEATISAIRVDWNMLELEALFWIIGKWSYFLPEKPANGSNRNLHPAKGSATVNLVCQRKLSIRTPDLQLCVSDDRPGQASKFSLYVKDVDWSSRVCTTTVTQKISISSISLQEGENVVVRLAGSPGLRAPALSATCQMKRAYSSNGHASGGILRFDHQITRIVITVDRLYGEFFLPHVQTILTWVGACHNRYLLGFIVSTSYGYELADFRRNLSKLGSQASSTLLEDSSCYRDEVIASLSVVHGLQLDIKHRDQTPGAILDGVAPIQTISRVDISSMSLQASGSGASCAREFELKGSLRNLQLTDMTTPNGLLPADAVLPNRQSIGSPSDMLDGIADVGSFGVKNVVDFVISSAEDTVGGAVVRVRLDSVCIVYLHRVFKQFHHYVFDHVVDVLVSPFDENPSCEKADAVFKSFMVNTESLPVSVEKLLDMYTNAVVTEVKERAGAMGITKGEIGNVRFEVVGNDLAFALPRSSFSRDSIIFRSTNARFWSSGIDPSTSDFLQNGTFADEARLSHGSALAGASAAKAQLSRRTELRNLRRQIKNQCSRILSNRSQLFIDLRSATQQAQNYLHEGFQALPAAEDAVKIIHNKIVHLDQQLEQLTQYLLKVDEALDEAKAEGEVLNSGGRDSLQFLASTPTNGSRGRSNSMEQIRHEVAGMSQHLMAPLFVAEDAEFHDARVASNANMMSRDNGDADMSTSSVGLFEFELVDFSGTTRDSPSPLFHHSLLTGRIDSEPESLSEAVLSSYFGISLSLNELSIGTGQEQYTTLLGMIYENFREVSRVVNEDTYPLCATCGGLHYDSEHCSAIWMRIPVKIADAALRISNEGHPVADMFWEQLELVFTLRTDDSLEFNASALSFTAVDIRPSRCQSASEVVRPLPGDGLQIEYNQKMNWTDTVYDLKVRNTNFLGIYPAFHDIVAFFAGPIFTEGEFLDFGVGYMSPPPPDWQKIDFFLTTTGCLFSLLEDFDTTDARSLVMLTDIVAAYSTHQKCEGAVDMTKCHLEFDQHGVYFSQLPDLQIDVAFPLSNSFLLVFDHFVQGSVELSRRNSFVLAPVETRFSVQDANLFINIANNYLRWIPSSSRSNSKKTSTSESRTELNKVTTSQTATPMYVADKLLGDVGELRLVLVNNSLGIPIADFHMREIVCEYIKDEDYSTTMGATLLFNYFNNSIYRWEPLVEPFVVQMRIHRALEENSLVEVFANLPNTVNFNMTPAMAPLLSSEALRQADFVTSGSKSTAPFWVENKTGLKLKFSFRRGTGTVIQQVVPDNGKVSVDCREQGDMLSFDSASADRFLRETDRQALTVNHTLSVWLNGNKWVSANPVVVDMVGHVAVPLRESLAPTTDADSDDFSGGDEDISPPTLVAEISIQADGSKLISLHSQVVLQNRTSVPLMVWAFSPRDGGCIQEWIIDREQVCHIPLQLVHPQSKISIRPSPYVQYAPLTTSLEELGDEVRAAKTVNTKRFVRAGNCICNFETFATMEELQSAAKSLETVSSSSMSSAIPLSGYVVRDLPTWKCTYEVEAFYLMRATFSSAEELPPAEKPALDLEKVEEEEGERVEDDFLHVFGEPAQRQRMNPLRDVNYELDEARAAGQRRGLYEATNSSLYYLSVSPFLTLHNRLATAMAYRLLNGSLQLIAEGILAVGNVLPLFQVDASELLYVSFRLENYNWSAPKLIINPKTSAYTVPYKDTIEPVPLLGRAFDRDITGEQSSVPNLQLQVKLSGRDVIVFCSIWIVNHTDLDLEYCNSTSSSSKRLENALKYVQLRAGSAEDLIDDFSTRSLSFHGEGGRDAQLTRLHKVKPSANPVAVIVVIREAKELYNAQYFGAQSPYVRASLYVLKNPKDRYLEKPEMVAICSATTKPSPSGGLSPQWDARLQNTLLLRFPPEVRTLDLARIIIEVRNVRYGLDTCLGVTAVKVDSILKDRKRAAAFNWYKLLKRKSSRERKASKNNLASVHRGDISMSFSVGTSQELPSDMDAAESVEEVVEEGNPPSFHEEETVPSFPQRQESEDFEFDDMEVSSVLDGQQTSGPLPSTSAARSMQRLQTPSSHDAGLIGVPASMRARQAYTFSGEAESTRAQELLSYDPTSTRAMGALLINGSPTKPTHTGKAHGVQVYLPHNRFACVVIEVYSSSLMSEVFDLVCMKCGFVGVLDIDDFDFYELALPRFVSLRSAGRPEGERWYGQPIPMTSTIENIGRRHGLHLCHRITMTTLRLYDETSTASSHHVTPRSLVTSSKRSNPAQIRPMPWGDVLPYSSGGKHWDVLRIKSRSSPWSDVIRLNRNAMGNSGVAQVISLTNEVYDQDQESELRKGSQEVALWSCYGSGRFSETIMATVVPRYILINKTEETIKYRQFDAPQTFRLAPNDLVPFHWPSASREKLLEVSVLHKYSWSGSFRINSLGTTYLKLRDRDDSSRIYILQCQIELVGGSVALIFREESKRFPPYRIDNMTSFRIRYKQTNWGEDKDFDELLPRSSCAYSWDYLNGSDGKSSSSSNQDPAFPGSSSSSSRSLQVRFMRVTSSTSKTGGDSDKDAVEIREYNLDEMASHKRIQLHRSLPSELFLKPEQKGYLLKKDSMLKWNRKYFRLYEHMLYYFANETDQELLGVVDLRTGSDVPGVGGVAIFEKAAEAPSKSGFISLNGLVSSISGSLFGGGSKQLGKDGDDDDDDGDDRSRELVRFAVSLTTSSVLCEESEKFVNAHIESGASVKSGVSRKGFYVNGQDLVDFLVTEMSTQTKAQAFTTAQEMMELGVLKPIQISSDAGAHKQAPLRSFQCSKIVWYSVDSINLADDSDLDSEDSSSITTPRDVEQAVASSKSKPLVIGSNQFSIITPTKCYDLKAKNPKIAKIWVRRLRLATQGGTADDIEDMPEETPMAGASLVPKTMRSQRDFVPQVQNAKTYVHVRIRADGPTKVLELFEGGEEDFDEKESKYELSSTASASSGSPTASETSTNAFESLTSGMALHLRMDGIGISCVNELPMELVYIYLGGISLHYSRVNSNMRMNITLDDVQIDNQSGEATFTKLLCPRMENGVAAATTPTRKRTVGDIDEDLAEMVSQGRGTGGTDDDSQEGTGLISNQNIFSCADCKYRQANVAAMHFCCTWSNEQGNTDYFKHCSFWLYPVITQLDEELLVSARAFMASMSQSWGENRSQNRGGEIRLKSIPIETMMESLSEYRENTLSDELNPLQSLKSYTTTSSSETRKVYFALLHIHPMDFDITFRSDVFQTSTTISLHEAASFKKAKFSGSHADEMKRSSSAPSLFSDSRNDDSSSATWTIPSLTMHVPDLDNAPVRLNALMIEHAFGTSGDLTRRVSKYYTRQLWKQLHKILGSFDFLGNPVGFLDHIGTGVRDFVYEPLEGLKIGGKGFSKGLAKGTASLMSNTVDGTFDAASKISGTFGQGFANLSLDDHYQQNRARARRRHVRGLREGLVQGSRELSLGVYEGVSGLVLNPMRGAQESGAVGFVRGTITGIIGLPVKPVAGIFDFASRATQGVRNRSLHNGQNMRRVRRPRVFGRYNELKCYKEADTIAYEMLKKVGGDRLSGEKIIFYNEIMQYVSAADLTREARDRRRSGSIGNGKPKSNDSTRERTNSLRRALQEDDERRRAAGEPLNSRSGESSGRKLRYEVVFYQKKLGMDLETDFYCENVTIKAMDETARSKAKVRGQIAAGQEVLQEGDCLIGVGGVDVRGIGFHETLALLRGTTRPVTVQFESAEELMQEAPTPKPDNTGGEGDLGATSRARLRRLSLAGPGAGNDAENEAIKKIKVQLSHWLIVTEQRVLYINVGSFSKPVVEWMTPLRYIYRVEWQKSTSQISLHLSVGVDSLPMGPRLRPSLKAIDGHERDMNVFLDVMWHSFGSTTAEEQELWPSDTSLNGYLLKKGGFSTVRRWFVLSRNCLYYFSSRKQLRGIIPLGHVRLETDAGDARCLRITNAARSQPLVTLQLDSGQVVERVQSEVVLVAASTQELEMWQSSLAHAAGKGMRHSRGTRFFVPTAASRLEIGTQETPDFVVKPLAEALKKTVEVFNAKLT
ncbi:putative vacuolar protein sorting-associated protein 13C [Phytophthora citrophthora]|uniref:Vacuolar protein sorting-associated protein 13C n=1 Tax=Phytophthora citrophthora TaxID=4793 RepID=A0AAD9H1E5_9STRA|nr:putative vacuolar protein sorting-associated protein 13C [Phytophthora citrophthora]